MAAISALLGFYYLQDFQNFFLAILIGLSTFFIAAGGYVINDFFDFKVDLINKPNRPLPRKSISMQSALYLSIIFFLVGVSLSLFLDNIYCLTIALINCISLFLYSYYFKKVLLLGNLIVAWNACSTFFYGALANENINNILPLTSFAFVYTLCREWVKTIEDYEGDKLERISTVPVVIGVKNTWILSKITTLLLLPLVFLFNWMDFVPNSLSFFTYLTIVFTFLLLNFNFTSMKEACKIQKYMKFVMIGIIFSYLMYDVGLRIF